MNTVEGFDMGNLVVRKLCRNLGSEALCELHLGGSLIDGGTEVILYVSSQEAADALYEACKGITTLEVVS